MIVVYGVANLLQSVRRRRAPTCTKASTPGCCCGWPVTVRTLSGSVCQMLGFVLAFLARRDLPLFLVQSSVGGRPRA